jgi:hypothetical protein
MLTLYTNQYQSCARLAVTRVPDSLPAESQQQAVVTDKPKDAFCTKGSSVTFAVWYMSFVRRILHHPSSSWQEQL